MKTQSKYLLPENPIPAPSIPCGSIKPLLLEIGNPLPAVPQLYMSPNMSVHFRENHNIARLRDITLRSDLTETQLWQQPRVSICRQNISRGTSRVQCPHHIPCATITRPAFSVYCCVCRSLCTIVTAKFCTLRHNKNCSCYYQSNCYKNVSDCLHNCKYKQSSIIKETRID